jgi:toxin ParE1/3/4
MAKYFLSPSAQKSLKSIKAYSLQNFGEKQTALYLRQLQNALKETAKNPYSGKHREDIKKNYYSCFIGSHTIYYRIFDTHIEIIDILHQRMEPKFRL